VFGLSFGEFMVLLLVAIVVLGPKEIPVYLRKAGQLAGRLRRMAYDMREKSGIDEVLRTEGIDRDIAEIRKLARGEIGGVVAAVQSATSAVRDVPGSPYAQTPASAPADPPTAASDREYPRDGADSYGALPDTAPVHEGGESVASPLAQDPLYARGEEGAPPAAEARP
jgi:sec-independent protein translocase protein TatB